MNHYYKGKFYETDELGRSYLADVRTFTAEHTEFGGSFSVKIDGYDCERISLAEYKRDRHLDPYYD